MTHDASEALNREFDLRYRPRPGAESFYRLDIVYENRDPDGHFAGAEDYRGDFKRVVESVSSDGAATETITWRNVFRRPWSEGGPIGEPEILDFAEGFTYSFSAEGPHEFGADYSSLPRDLVGWNFLLLTVDAHYEFDMMRSVRHGSVHKLQRLGESNQLEEPGVDLVLEPFIGVRGMQTTGVSNGFTGLTVRHGHPCAIVSFSCVPSPFTMQMNGMDMSCSTSLAGRVEARLDDGSVEYGYDLEWVFIQGMPITSRAVYRLTRIDQSDYRGGVEASARFEMR